MICAWTLPYPIGVSVNHLYVGGGPRRHLTRVAMDWRNTVILAIRQKAIDGGEKLVLPPGNLAFWLDVFPPDDSREHDGDNLLKFTVDSVMAAFLELDPRVREYHVRRLARSASPHLTVMIGTSLIEGD